MVACHKLGMQKGWRDYTFLIIAIQILLAFRNPHILQQWLIPHFKPNFILFQSTEAYNYTLFSKKITSVEMKNARGGGAGGCGAGGCGSVQ